MFVADINAHVIVIVIDRDNCRSIDKQENNR